MMLTRVLYFIAYCICTSIVVAAPNLSHAASASRIALVIGNQHYGNPEDDLSGARRDADTIAKALGDPRLNFTVTVKRDLTQKQMRLAVDEFATALQKAGPSVIGILYFAGHGGTDAELTDNFLIPVDVPDVASVDVLKSAYGLKDVTERLALVNKPAAIAIVIDACRTLSKSKSNAAPAAALLSKMVSPNEQQPGMLVALSTSSGLPASDSGRFANALAQDLLTEGFTVDQVFEHVRVEVARITDRQQIPMIRSSVVEERLCLISCIASGGGPYSQNKELFESTRQGAQFGLERLSMLEVSSKCPKSWGELSTLRSKAEDLVSRKDIDAAGATYAHIKERAGEMYPHLYGLRVVAQTDVMRQQQYEEQLARRRRDNEADFKKTQERLQQAEARLRSHEQSHSTTKDRKKARTHIAEAERLAREGQYEDANDRLVDAINAIQLLDDEIEPTGRRVLKYETRKAAPRLIANADGRARLESSATLCQ